jgi:ABC-type iron transport system FetAB permease component
LLLEILNQTKTLLWQELKALHELARLGSFIKYYIPYQMQVNLILQVNYIYTIARFLLQNRLAFLLQLFTKAFYLKFKDVGILSLFINFIDLIFPLSLQIGL